MSENVRVRFAPSPTGFLHVGGARTALFNWLYARHYNGAFIVRIEDTDRSRSTRQACDAIVEGLQWLGLDWDEGPYYQMERLSIYESAVAELKAAGKAYDCYCTREELEAQKDEAKREKRLFHYNRRCLGRSEAEKQELRRRGIAPAVRFLVEGGPDIVVNDLVRGEVRFQREQIGDMIIVRPDGVPTYNFAAAVDDHSMGVTHVIRGEDHLSNTPKQILLGEALGYPRPEFGHLPLILGKDKSLLSKRHGATSVTAYRDAGYLPEAMVNYLALLGWSLDDRTTIMTAQEMIEGFSMERVGKAAAVFDLEKLRWMNGVYIRSLTPEQLTERLAPFWIRAGLITEGEVESGKERLARISKICAERLTLLADIVPLTDFFFREPEFDAVAEAAVLTAPDSARYLREAARQLSELRDWRPETIEAELRELAGSLGAKAAKVFQPIRVAVTGKKVSPPLFETLWILGKEPALRRIDGCLEKMG